MTERFPESPVESEPILSEVKNTPWIKDFGDPETGLGRLLMERTGATDTHFALVAYLPNQSDPHLFRRGAWNDCIAKWPDAVEWMTERFPENKA